MISKKYLDKQYGVYGSFFKLFIMKDVYIPCRNVLEIVKNDYNEYDYMNYANYEPDIIAIMMNPGSSSPKYKSYQESSYNSNIKDIGLNDLTETIPDNTQYQIMRFMSKFNFRHARILNISDVREPKSSVFKKKVSKTKYNNILCHSIFSDSRAEELQGLMSDKSLYLLAWGVDSKLKALANQAYDKVKHMRTFGKLKIDNLYYHPLPQDYNKQKEWLRDIEDIIEKTGYIQ
ncbi:DUF1643 domain-containing protein [Clostridium sp. 'deep sea']|uniref:DUF1643 domain-containing protein n=1 Tax=Clostridium sp. 'deep sea' TaxID=2779445 RepID=UPI0018967D0B|nr:DUF1643 domain-containing protein [Clostridium sp. 'deep sea']QOR36884.1 DUF1643 domain-containing protein [Clostridium sp. 'deep sea']